MCCFRAAKSRAAKRKGVKSLTEGLEKIENVRLSDDETKVVILDQEKLPNAEEYLELDNAEDIYEAISMKACVGQRSTIGAPGKAAMEKVIRAEEEYLAAE